MKNFGPQWSGISGLCSSFLFSFSLIIALTSPASARSGSGSGAHLTVTPSSINFGTAPVGSTQTQTVTLTNPGSATIMITQATSAGPNFTVSGLSLPATLTSGQSITCNVAFTPQVFGSLNGRLSLVFTVEFKGHGGTINYSSNYGAHIPLSGTGVGANAGQLTTSPASLTFSNVLVGSTQTLPETLTNSGGTSVTISAAGATASFSTTGLSLPATLNPGQSLSFSVAFSPTSAATTSGSLTLTSNASNPSVNLPLSGTGTTPGHLASNPASLNFGSVPSGTTATLSETLTNSGGLSLTVSQIASSAAAFSVSGVAPPLTLAAGQSVTFNVAYASAGATTSGSLAITDSANSGVSVPLSGAGSLPGQLTVAPTAINFGSVVAGTTQVQTGTLSAGSSAVTISSVGVSTSQFSLSGLSLPVTISPGSSISYQLTFAPATSGTAAANVTFISNASNSPSVESVSGSATAPQHSVALAWSASSSNDVVAYNIYRGTASGGSST